MTAPRMLLPDTTYLVSRRCSERRFFLTPTAVVNQVFAYCLAYAAKETNVLLHAWVTMGNHWHAVVTDPDVNLPDFMALVDRLVAKCLNIELKRFENFWSPEPYSAVRLEDEATIIDKILYVLANPTAAGLVKSNSQWPGLTSGPRACAELLRKIRRPAIFFDPLGLMPEVVELAATVPLCLADERPHHFAAMLAAKLKTREQDIREDLAKSGRTIAGPAAVKAQDPFDCPTSHRPSKDFNPSVASASKWHRVEALQRLKEFLDAYLDAWRDFQRGNKDTVFPAGTYWMRRHAGCASVPP